MRLPSISVSRMASKRLLTICKVRLFLQPIVSATDRARSFLVIVGTKTSLDEELNRL